MEIQITYKLQYNQGRYHMIVRVDISYYTTYVNLYTYQLLPMSSRSLPLV